MQIEIVSNTTVRFLVILTIAGVLASCLPAAPPEPTSPPATATIGLLPTENPTLPPTRTTPPATATPMPTLTSEAAAPVARFASYQPMPVALPASHIGYELPLDLNRVDNLDRFEFSEGQRAKLAANGFVVAPVNYREFFHLYEEVRYQELPVFVTTDSVFHIYHLLFDKVLRTGEADFFAPDLPALDRALLDVSLLQLEELKGTSLESAARRNVGYFTVAVSLLDPDFAPPEAVAEQVEAELALIEAHAGLAPSPLFGYKEDYSQYIARGHYTRSEALSRYFRAMMWHGRMTFQYGPDPTLSALLLINALEVAEVKGEPALKVWDRIYEPTVFFVGRSDDPNYYDYAALRDEVYGVVPDLLGYADEAKLTRFIDEAKRRFQPEIVSLSIAQGFRFMGQRFVIDAYIFNQLIYDRIPGARMLPRGLDLFAAMGSEEAYRILEELGETTHVGYAVQMERLRREMAAKPLECWTQNLYWAWLYAFQPLIEPKEESYPSFMQTQAWRRKDLHTALGSWAELKHDTILYAKQVYAEMGNGPEERPKGYVEPTPEVYARLAALTKMTIEGLAGRGLLTDFDRESLSRLENLLLFLKTVAEKELAGMPLTEEEYERIRYYGGELELLTMAAADAEERGGRMYSEEEAAVIADVATDPLGGRVLEEAVGRVFEIYVVVEIESNTQIAKGSVFSYYEFPWPMEDRLTDEKWREMLGTGQAPERPQWTQSFVAE